MLLGAVDRCPACSCSSLHDAHLARPAPRLVRCPRGCDCHGPVTSLRASLATTRGDMARLRAWRAGERPQVVVPVGPAAEG